MSVNWSWNEKMGEIKIRQRNKNYKINLYSANCVCAMIYDFKEDGKPMYSFYGFFNDFGHLKRCIGLEPNKTWNYETKKYQKDVSNIYKDEWKKIKLNIYYRDMLKMGELCAKAGFKVELYYKEPKRKKKTT